MVTFENIIRDINMRNLLVFESALSHEKKNIGVKPFCAKYEEGIEEFKKILSYTEFCFLLSYLEYFDPNFRYDESFKLDGYVLDIEDKQALDWGFEDEINLELSWDLALPQFRSRGFLTQSIDGVVGE